MKEIFDTQDIRHYLQFKLEGGGKGRRGSKMQFARTVQCNAAYVTRILEGVAQLSLEQGMRANLFFGHSPEEAEYFLCLIGFARAGSKELREYYRRKLELLREQHHTLSKRIKNTETLPELTQSTYYSLWLYAAVDIATSIPALQTPEALSAYFAVSLGEVVSILSFLQKAGLVRQEEGRWMNTNRQIYLPSDSPHLRKHHLNWRLKAMQLIERPQTKNLHYSSVISLSKKDLENLKQHFIQSVMQAREIVKGSADEVIAAYTVDCFQIE